MNILMIEDEERLKMVKNVVSYSVKQSLFCSNLKMIKNKQELLKSFQKWKSSY